MKNGWALILPIVLMSTALSANSQPLGCSGLLEYFKIKLGQMVSRPNFNQDQFYWNFPSDHLPAVGVARLNTSSETFSVLTWNVLNQNYLPYMLTDANTQGLRVSEITATGDRANRIMTVLSEFMADLKPGLVGLQEVDKAVLHRLQIWARLNGYGLLVAENPLKGEANAAVDHGVILFDLQKFTVQPGAGEQIPFVSDRGPTKYIQKVSLVTNRGGAIVFVNVHRDFLDRNVFNQFVQRPPDGPTILVGDLNLQPNGVDEILKYTDLYTRMKKGPHDFTHIDTKRDLTDYDHILFSGALVVKDAPSLTLRARKHFRIESEAPAPAHF